MRGFRLGADIPVRMRYRAVFKESLVPVQDSRFMILARSTGCSPVSDADGVGELVDSQLREVVCGDFSGFDFSGVRGGWGLGWLGVG